MKLKRTGKLLALLLAAVMVVGLLPTMALAKPGDTVDKAALGQLISTVTGANAANFYQSGDRYNGTNEVITGKNNGFWKSFTASNGPLAHAQGVYGNSTDQGEVDAEVIALAAAIAKLIPKTKVNATELYEAVQREKKRTNLKEADYTALSWSEYCEARSAADDYLTGLFNGKYENIAANQTVANAYKTALDTAYSGLYKRSDYALAQE